jgi:hypothetical protein
MKLIIDYKHSEFPMGVIAMIGGLVGVIFSLTSSSIESMFMGTMGTLALLFFGMMFLQDCFKIESCTKSDNDFSIYVIIGITVIVLWLLQHRGLIGFD